MWFSNSLYAFMYITGNGAPVPLTQLPPHCGHTTPTYGGLVYATPYDGCGVAQKVLRSLFNLA